MSWWAQFGGDQDRFEPFTVVLSVGPPSVLTGHPDSDDLGGVSASDDDGRHWVWQDTITTLLHAIFTRGGSVVARFDEATFPLLWATALRYAEALPAEHGDRRMEVPLEIIATERWYEAADADVDAFEATGAVRIWRERPEGPRRPWPPGPGPHFGVILLAGGQSSDDLSLLDRVERLLAVDWTDAPTADALATRVSDRFWLEDGFEPVDARFESYLDGWLGLGG
jgi:hypothetical protein